MVPASRAGVRLELVMACSRVTFRAGPPPRDVLEWPYTVGGGGRTPPRPPPPPPLPMFEADSQNFASAPLAPRGCKFEFLGPPSAGPIGGPKEEGCPGQPAPPFRPPPFLVHPCRPPPPPPPQRLCNPPLHPYHNHRPHSGGMASPSPYPNPNINQPGESTASSQSGAAAHKCA